MKWLDLPPVWTVLFAALMWGAAKIAPWPGVGSDWPGGALIAIAVWLTVWTALTFRRARTTIIPHLAPDALATDGPMRFSRNPIYLGDVLALVGWGLILGSVAALIFAPALAVVLRQRFILPEEARLKAAFGDEFVAYQSRVRRWI